MNLFVALFLVTLQFLLQCDSDLDIANSSVVLTYRPGSIVSGYSLKHDSSVP